MSSNARRSRSCVRCPYPACSSPRFSAPCSSRAMAVLTQESIPPLSSTTAFLRSLMSLSARTRRSTVPFPLFISLLLYFSISNALRRRVPDEFVQLQSQPHRQTISKDPFGQRARLQPLPFPFRVFKHRREQNLLHTPRQSMLQREVARKFIIAPRRKHEFHFVLLRQRLEIPHIKSIRLSRVRALYIHDLDDLAWKPLSGTFPARTYHYRVAGIQQLFGKRINFFL